MRAPRLRWTVAVVLLLGVASEARYYLGQESLLSSEEELEVQALAGSIEPVRSRFQEAKGHWRMVVLASPMAPTSFASLARLYDDFLSIAPELPIEITVVFSRALPWDHRNKARTSARYSGDHRWRFFWDPEDRVGGSLLAAGRQGSSRVEGRYLVYRPEADWPRDGRAPAPALELQPRGATAGLGRGAFSGELDELRERIARVASQLQE